MIPRQMLTLLLLLLLLLSVDLVHAHPQSHGVDAPAGTHTTLDRRLLRRSFNLGRFAEFLLRPLRNQSLPVSYGLQKPRNTASERRPLNATEDADRLLALQYASAAYCHIPRGSFQCGPSCAAANVNDTIVTYRFHQNSAVGFVGYSTSQQVITVGFRGTWSVPQALTDLEMFQTAYRDEQGKAISGVMVHQGFYSTYQSVGYAVVSAVKALYTKLGPGYRVVLSGHSLGGALAVLCAMDTLRRLPEADIHVFTFGQPRLGNYELARLINATPIKIWRFVLENDIIPHLPTTALGFVHHRTEVWLRNRTLLLQDTNTMADGSNTAFLPVVCHSDDGEDAVCSRRYNYDLLSKDVHSDYWHEVQVGCANADSETTADKNAQTRWTKFWKRLRRTKHRLMGTDESVDTAAAHADTNTLLVPDETT